ncbi:MAG: DUF1501 domain-containing protein [Planctomycetota bacterium]|nr:DUF1501 domain-containing protein [Planctomycetota bacterium]
MSDSGARHTRDSMAAAGMVSRRAAIRAGAIGLMGLGLAEFKALRAAARNGPAPLPAKARSVIYIFLSGGLSQIDSFDMKPDAKKEYRGSFQPIATRTEGIKICEHLPLLARRSDSWSICRSMTHPFNEHSEGHMVMLSGRSDLPPGFNLNKPKESDWPSMAAIAKQLVKPRGIMPSVLALPERLVHRTGRVIPGQFGGRMGERFSPWFLDASTFNSKSYGAYPEYTFHHENGPQKRSNDNFTIPQLSLSEELSRARLRRRVEVLESINSQQQALQRAGKVKEFRRYHDLALGLLGDPRTRNAFDLSGADSATLERYGQNSFGWSLLTARKLVEAGVNLVQVNLGNNETWDTHVKAFHNLEKYLFPPMDRAVSALLDDLSERGLLDDTLVVMAGEFGRTPKIFSIGKGKPPGRDHWGAVQTVWFAGGGVRGGQVIGSSDADGGQPKDNPQKPENMAATIFEALGVPRDLHWQELRGRPHPVYSAEPIPGLL